MSLSLNSLMNRKIADLTFRNPVVTASGTFGMGDEYQPFIDYSGIGAVTLKTVTKNPRKGNPPPRIRESYSGLLNSIGLENEGFEQFLQQAEKLEKKPFDTVIIVSLSGESAEDFWIMAERLNSVSWIDMIELNLSCPNVHSGGANFDHSPETVCRIIEETEKRAKKSFSVKFGPNHQLVENVHRALESGADAAVVSNTFLGTAIDPKTGKFVFANKVAGYSGPAVKPMALWNLVKVREKTPDFPVIASGGIASADDAREFLYAGANLVSIGTMNFIDPRVSQRIAEELTAE